MAREFFESQLLPHLISNNFQAEGSEMASYIDSTFRHIEKYHLMLFTTNEFLKQLELGVLLDDRKDEFRKLVKTFINQNYPSKPFVELISK